MQVVKTVIKLIVLIVQMLSVDLMSHIHLFVLVQQILILVGFHQYRMLIMEILITQIIQSSAQVFFNFFKFLIFYFLILKACDTGIYLV